MILETSGGSLTPSSQSSRQLVKSSRPYGGVRWRVPEPSEVPPGGKLLGGKKGEPLYSKCDQKGVCQGHPSAPGGSPGPLGSARQEDPLASRGSLGLGHLWGTSIGGIPQALEDGVKILKIVIFQGLYKINDCDCAAKPQLLVPLFGLPASSSRPCDRVEHARLDRSM